jgi:translocator assembly and maintenance protein 41
MIKYGVVGKDAFEQDLCHWSHIYISGRLHKPVAALNQNTEANTAQQHNLRSALMTALLMSPKASTLKDLFKRITSLSYLGDVRMGLAEDSKKVERIVAGSYDRFQELYLPLLQTPEMRDLGVMADAEGLQQDDSLDTKSQLMSKLPSVLLARTARKLGPLLPASEIAAAAAVLASASASVSAALPPLSNSTRLDIAAAAVGKSKYKKLIKSGLHAIVANSSRRQAVAGLLYAGPIRSLQYVGRKLAKAWR